MILARELGPSSDQVVEYWLRKWRKGDDDALKPKSKGRPKGAVVPTGCRHLFSAAFSSAPHAPAPHQRLGSDPHQTGPSGFRVR